MIRCPEEPPFEVQLQEIRPHTPEIIPFNELKIGDRVLMNYNAEYNKERGYWYDVLVKDIRTTRKGRDVIGDVSVGVDNAVLSNCHLMFLDDIFKVAPYKLLADRTPEEDKIIQTEPTTKSNNEKLKIYMFDYNLLCIHFSLIFVYLLKEHVHCIVSSVKTT